MKTDSIQIKYRLLSPEETYGGPPPQFENRPFPKSQIDAETTFYDKIGQKLLEEPYFAIGHFQLLLEEWLKHPADRDFIMQGKEIGWYCDIQFKVTDSEITFIALAEDKLTAQAKFPIDSFILYMRKFNTQLISDISEMYPNLSP
jgi:hypothetical protein